MPGIVSLLFLFSSLTTAAFGIECFELGIPICQGYGYSSTTIGYEGQLAMQQMIVSSVADNSDKGFCKALIRPFLCYTFVPKCRKRLDYGVKPCQITCELLKRRCKKKMKNWPVELLNCDKQFLSRGRNSQCISTGKLKGFSKVARVKPIITSKGQTNPTTQLTSNPIVIDRRKVSTFSKNLVNATKRNKPTTTFSSPTDVPQGQSTTPILQRVTQKTRSPIKLQTTAPQMTSTPRSITPTPQSFTPELQKSSESTPTQQKTGSTRTREVPTTAIERVTKASPSTPKTTTNPSATTRQIWVSKIKRTTSVAKTTTATPTTTTTPTATTTPTITATPTMTTKATPPPSVGTNSVQTTGPIFNPFYPPTFTKFEDPRDRSTTVLSNPTTTPALVTVDKSETISEPFTPESVFNTTSTEAWYRKVDIKWLVEQVNNAIQQARDDPVNYTTEWDLSNYTKFLDMLRKKPDNTPWYLQDYWSIISKVNVSAIEFRGVNITIGEGGNEETEKKNLFQKLFGKEEFDTDRPQADAVSSEEGVVYPVYITGSDEVDKNKTSEKLRRVLEDLGKKYYN